MTQQNNAPVTTNPKELKPEDYQAALDNMDDPEFDKFRFRRNSRFFTIVKSALTRAAKQSLPVEVHTDGVAVVGSSPVCKSRARRVGDIAVGDEATSATPSVCTELDAAIVYAEVSRLRIPRDKSLQNQEEDIFLKLLTAAKAHRASLTKGDV